MENNFNDELTEEELARLTSALASLPENLLFLREPILDIASQDQDLLGCGEADPSKLADALADQLRADVELSVTSMLQQLRKWSRKAGVNKKETWCAPIIFAIAFLTGAEWYTIEELTAPMPKQPEPGLFKIAMDIPENAKATFLAGGVRIKIRGVEVIISEEVAAWASDDRLAGTQPAPHLQFVVENDLQMGAATAKRLSLQNLDTGRCMYAQYVLSFADLQIQAFIGKRSLSGFDIAPYETILASIRPKEPRTQ